MTTLPPRFHLHTTPMAPQASIVSGPNYRITVLTDALVRFEWSPSGSFEDRATQIVLNRDFPTPDFTLTRDGEAVQIITANFQLNYDGQVPSISGLEVKSGGNYHGVWRPGDKPDSKFSEILGIPVNLGGTARTLDAVDGPTPLEDGIMSTVGPTEVDDSGTLALLPNGWIAPREQGAMDVYLFCYGTDYQRAITDFYRLTGPQPMLPRFALGNWWSRYHKYTQTEYQALIEKFEDHNLPFSVAVIDMDWHLVDIDPKYGHGWTGYTWNKDYFPDHVAFMSWLHEHGLKVSLNVHPADGVRAHEEAYQRFAEAMGIDPTSELPVNFDIANPDFLLPYFEQVHHPMEDEGVDFWWLDWQQGTHSRVPGLDPLWMLNHYHFLDSARTGKRPMTFSRYAGPGSHRYPIGFSGDTVITWESLDFQPYFTATASNIGYGWWSHDIGGHMFGYKNDELATRWVQFGVFSPINRLHSTQNIFNGKEPWRYNKLAEQIQGDFLRFRHRLLPYLYTMNERAHTLAEPICRPMYWTPNAPRQAFRHSNQYWFGSELIVAPITGPADADLQVASVDAWLPPGQWVDIFTGLVYAGDRFITFHRKLDAYPVLAAAGSIVPLTGVDSLRADSNPDALELRVYAGADGEFVLYEDDDAADPSACRTTITFDWVGSTLTVHPAQGDLSVIPASRHVAVELWGVAPVGVVGTDSTYDAATGVLRFSLGQVDSAEGVSVHFEGPLTVSDNQVGARVFAWLDQAEIEFTTKEAIWAIVDAGTSPARTVADLQALNLDPLVFAVISEFVLANAG